MTRVLVVEDDRDIAELVVRYLEKAGFAVDALSGRRLVTGSAGPHIAADIIPVQYSDTRS